MADIAEKSEYEEIAMSTEFDNPISKTVGWKFRTDTI